MVAVTRTCWKSRRLYILSIDLTQFIHTPGIIIVKFNREEEFSWASVVDDP